jgi:hypothetical protein
VDGDGLEPGSHPRRGRRSPDVRHRPTDPDGRIHRVERPGLGGIAEFQGTSTQGSFFPPWTPGETRIISGQEASNQTFGYNAEIEYPSLAPPAVISPATSQPTPVATSVASAPARCVVPKVIGKKLKAARKSIQESGCNVGLVTKKHGVKAATGKVVRQSPNGGRVVAAHTAVNLKLGSH